MLDKFWENIGTNVAERWIEYIFGPAFLFWAGGFGFYAWRVGWQQFLDKAQALDQFQQGSWIILTLLILVLSSVIMQAIRFPILRLLEGYWPWPFNYLGLGVIALRKPYFQKRYAELRKLIKISEEQGKIETEYSEKLIELEDWAHRHPSRSNDLLPTALGNILRARERSPENKYGLDAVICWSRLWPLLPEHVRTDLASARSSLDRLAELCFWGFIFILWTYLTPWAAIIGLIWILMAYSMACQSAMTYGDFLETAFDLYRFLLYDAMGWPRPKNIQEEKKLGAQLTEYLWRGTSPDTIIYRINE